MLKSPITHNFLGASGLALSLALAAMPAVAHAQDADSADEAKKEDIVVTGTLIRGAQVTGVDAVAVLAKGRDHRGLAQRIDQSRHAAGIAVQQWIAGLGKDGAPCGACHLEAMQHIGAHVLFRQRREVKTQPHALGQLDQLG